MITNVVHVTSTQGYNGIVLSGHLASQFSLGQGGEGGRRRRIADKRIVMKDKEWYKHYDEARGIFFRIETTVACPKRNFFRYGGEVALEFSPALLKDHRDWIINTEENNGFVFGDHGVESYSLFSGEPGRTLYGNDVCEHDLLKVDAALCELLIDSPAIDLSHLSKVTFKRTSLRTLSFRLRDILYRLINYIVMLYCYVKSMRSC